MAQGAQILRADEPSLASEHETAEAIVPPRIPLRQLLAPLLTRAEEPAVVPLFPDRHRSEAPSNLALADADWPAAIQLIRNVGARMRLARQSTQENAERSQALVQQCLRRAEVAERRVFAAEAAASAALLRAKQAEAAAQAAEARACRAEEEMQAARAKQAEVQMWLKHLYTCVLTEFEGLTEDPA